MVGNIGKAIEWIKSNSTTCVMAIIAIIGWVAMPYIAYTYFAPKPPKLPQPDVHFVKEKCPIVPVSFTNSSIVYIKLVVKNDGSTKESSLWIDLRVSDGWNYTIVFMNTTSEIFSLPAGESATYVWKAENPIEGLRSIWVYAEVKNTKEWDAWEVTDWW